jgi:membrane protein
LAARHPQDGAPFRFLPIDSGPERLMSLLMDLRRLRDWRYYPGHRAVIARRVVGKSLARLWGRDVMLYTGGVSFFALLAVFPAVAMLLGVYSLLLTPDQAVAQADVFSRLLPPGAHDLFQQELLRLAHAPIRAVSAQSVIALLVGVYAAHRGFKALLAGLSFIHDEEAPLSFWSFNLLAMGALAAAFALTGFMTGIFLAVRLVAAAMHLSPLKGVHWFYSEWTWASIGMTLGLTLIYRFAMSRRPVAWGPSIAGGVAAAILTLAASWASAFYVQQIAQFGATYGSIAAVVVMLIWLSWNVNAVFFGAALATEIEIFTETPTVIPASSQPAT